MSVKKVSSLAFLSLFMLFSLLILGCTGPSVPKSPQSTQNEGTNQNIESKPDKPKEVLDKPKEVPSLKPADFFPVPVGASWEYAGEGNEYAAFKRKVLFCSGDLAQISEDNGGTVSASVYKISSDAVTRIFFRGEEYSNTNYLTAKPNDNQIILKTPFSVGTKWNEKNGTREIVDTNSSVTTPKGSFDQCLKIKISYQDSVSFEYFKQGVGLVKREFVSGETRVTSSLKSYSLQ
jgi:hypothetical protein